LDTSEKLWWSRYLLALAISPLSAYISFKGILDGFSAYLAFLLALLGYILTVLTAKYVFRVKPESLKRPKDLALQGVFAYFIAWFSFWVFFYTLMLWSAGMV